MSNQTPTPPTKRNLTQHPAFLPVLLFLAAFTFLAALSGPRALKPSPDNHFVYLADSFNHGALELQKPPPHKNDWATVEHITLRSGQELRGVWINRQTRRFRTLDNKVMVIDRKEVDPKQRKTVHYVSFPPAPAVLMMPLVAIWGYRTNDVLFTLFFAALNVALAFIFLRTLSQRNTSQRSTSDNLWLTALLGLGTVHLWCSVLGQVWFTALTVGLTFNLLYMLCAIDTRRPFLAGLFLACAFSTRTPLLFSAVFFFGFLLFPNGKRLQRQDLPEAAKKFALFAAPCLVIGVLLLLSNAARFGSLTEFGHTYLAGGQIGRIQKYGLFNIHFLSKNLSAAFTLLPRFQASYPFVIVSRHGMSLLLTTPAFLYLLWPKKRRDDTDRFWWRLGWCTVACVAIPGFLYQNTGYEQFGYRFSLDYTPYLVLLLAISHRPITRLFKALILFGIAVNTFGAITFKRFDQFYMPGSTFFDPD